MHLRALLPGCGTGAVCRGEFLEGTLSCLFEKTPTDASKIPLVTFHV